MSGKIVSKESLLHPDDHPLERCSVVFIGNLGLLCKHMIYQDYLSVDKGSGIREVYTL